jgi:hypothetical protein
MKMPPTSLCVSVLAVGVVVAQSEDSSTAGQNSASPDQQIMNGLA